MNALATKQFNFKSLPQIIANIIGNESVMNQNILLKLNKNVR